MLQIHSEELKWELFRLWKLHLLTRTNDKERDWSTFDDSEEICINPNYKNRQKTIDCRNVRPRPTPKKTGGKTHHKGKGGKDGDFSDFGKSIQRERDMIIDVIIVRYMKFKGTAQLKDIMANVGMQVKVFKPSSKMIKARMKYLTP